MSEYAPGSFHFAERIMELNVQERRHETESSRLLGRSNARRESVQRFFCGALARFGNHLSAWGERLEERFSTEASAPARQSA
jgi:hypothetical protein